MQNQTSTMRIPIRSSRNSLDPYPSLPERFGSVGDEIVPDTFDVEDVPHQKKKKKKKRHCIGTSETNLDLEDACIVCEVVSDNRVFRCCGINCPVSFHQECLDAEFSGGSRENPFCPYCWFKIVSAKSKAFRDEAIEAEKTVCEYLDKEMESDGEVNESVEKRREDTELCGDEERSLESTDIVSDQELQGEKDAPLSKEKHVQVDKDFDTPPLTDQPEDEERVATENIEDDVDDETGEEQMKVAGEKGDVSVSPVLPMRESFSGKEDEEQVQQNENRRRRRFILNATDIERNGEEEEDVTAKVNNKGAGKKRDGAPFLSMQEESFSEHEDQVQQNENRRRRRWFILNATDIERHEGEEEDVTGKVNDKDAGEKGDVGPVLSMQETFSEHEKVKQKEKQSSRRRRRLILNDTDSEFSSTKERNVDEDVTTKEINSSTKVSKSKTVAREISFFNKDQRRRLLWTPEEEEMLKVGVERFAAEANKNMPWRKILEMGENVFHETRTPADLKDKWRNMIRLGKITN